MLDVFVSDNLKKKRKSKKTVVKRKSLHPETQKIKKQLKHPKSHREKERLPGHTHNPLAAFNHYPCKVKFVNKDLKEKVILLLRKHPITNVKWIVISALMLLAPSFLPLLSLFDLLPVRFQVVFATIWYLMTTAYIFEKFLIWYFHVNIVTDERIIEVDFHHLIYREITDANIDQIQDVTVQMGSAIRTVFNYGDIEIQTAAEIVRINFEAVPYPDKVAKILRDLRIEEEIEKLEGRIR